jgi:hypothetical protein
LDTKTAAERTDPADYYRIEDSQAEMQSVIVWDMIGKAAKAGFHFVKPVQVEFVPGRWDSGQYIHSDWLYTVVLYDRLNMKSYGIWTGKYIEFVYLLERIGKNDTV